MGNRAVATTLCGISAAAALLGICGAAMAATPPANMAEVSATVSAVIQAAKQGNGAVLEVFSAAMEGEKKTTVPWRAAAVAANIRKTCKLSEKDFAAMRAKHAFFDLAIGCAVSKATKMPLAQVMQEREVSLWQEILPKRFGKDGGRISALAPDIEKLLE